MAKVNFANIGEKIKEGTLMYKEERNKVVRKNMCKYKRLFFSS